MLRERFLGWCDRLISTIFFFGSDYSCEMVNGIHRHCYFVYCGPRFGIVRKGELIRIGGYYERIHTYDAQGNLLSRTIARKQLEEGDQLLVGAAVQKKYLERGDLLGPGLSIEV